MWCRNTKRCILVSLAVSLGALLAGCSSITPQEAGYILGSIAGGIVGSAPGAAAGALLGTAAGALVAKPIEVAQQKKERQTLQDRLDAPAGSNAQTAGAATPPPAPMVDTSRPQRIWIDEQVIDGRVIPGHVTERYTVAARERTPADASANALAVDRRIESAVHE